MQVHISDTIIMLNDESLLFILELGPLHNYNTCMSTHALFEGLRSSPLDREFPSFVGHMDVRFPQETKIRDLGLSIAIQEHITSSNVPVQRDQSNHCCHGYTSI